MPGRKGARFNDPFHPLKTAQILVDTYDWAEFTVADATTNYDTKSNETDMFNNVKNATFVIIETDQDVTIRFNNTDLPAINHLAALSPWEWRQVLNIKNIFITNTSGSTANIKIFLA